MQIDFGEKWTGVGSELVRVYLLVRSSATRGACS